MTADLKKSARRIVERYGDMERIDYANNLAPGTTLADVIEIALGEAVEAERGTCAALADAHEADCDARADKWDRLESDRMCSIKRQEAEGARCIAAAIRARKGTP